MFILQLWHYRETCTTTSVIQINYMSPCNFYLILTHISQDLLAKQFLVVLMRWGGSERKCMYLTSSVYGLSDLYTGPVSSLCNEKKWRFDDAPSAVAATTLNPILSSRKTVSQNGLKRRSPDTDLQVNWAQGKFNLKNNPLTKKTNMLLARSGESSLDSRECSYSRRRLFTDPRLVKPTRSPECLSLLCAFHPLSQLHTFDNQPSCACQHHSRIQFHCQESRCNLLMCAVMAGQCSRIL